MVTLSYLKILRRTRNDFDKIAESCFVYVTMIPCCFGHKYLFLSNKKLSVIVIRKLNFSFNLKILVKLYSYGVFDAKMLCFSVYQISFKLIKFEFMADEVSNNFLLLKDSFALFYRASN